LHLPAPAEALVWLTLRRLQHFHLLQESGARPADIRGITRRQALRQLRAIGGLVALAPVITSIIAPTPTMAASCTPARFKADCVDECQAHADCGQLGFCGIVPCPDDPFHGHNVCISGCR